jgi:uncharacterized membrane protein YkoI
LSLATAEGAKVQMNSSRMSGAGQNQSKMMMGTSGPNITGTIPLEPTIVKAISSQVHVSLANASIIAKKAVGANAHAAAVRIGVVHGFLVYMALIVDSNNNFHGVLVDAGNGKVLASTQMSMMAMMQGGMGINLMGPGMMQHGMGMMGPGMGMMGPGMMQHGMMKSPGMMMGHPKRLLLTLTSEHNNLFSFFSKQPFRGLTILDVFIF